MELWRSTTNCPERPAIPFFTLRSVEESGILWWALRSGFFAALKIGMGGRFGGGGADGSD